MLFFYSGNGSWRKCSKGEYDALDDEFASNVNHLFRLRPSDEKKLKYQAEVQVQFLLPCYDHTDGATPEQLSDFGCSFTKKDNVDFRIHQNLAIAGDKTSYEGIIICKDEVLEEKQLNVEKVHDLKPKAETTYLHITAALLDCILNGVAGKDKHPSFKNQADLIETIVSQYQGYSGLSKRTLEEKFSLAKKSLE